MAENKTMIGIIKKLETKSGNKKDGSSWTKGTVHVEVNGTTLKVSTFDSENMTKVMQLQNKNVEITYTETEKDGITYKNMTKNGIKESTEQASVPSNNAPSTQNNNVPAPSNNNYEISERRKTRSMVTAYAKDLVVADKVELNKMLTIADQIYKYVWTGLTPEERAKRLAAKTPELKPASEVEDDYSDVEEDIVE